MKFIDENEPVKVQQESKPISKIEYWPINDIPSKFILYPKGTKLEGRILSVLEVKKLALLNADNFDFVINSILSEAIKGIEVKNLFVQDKLYLIFWLRSNTYREPGYTTKFMCPICEKQSQYEFDLTKLEVEYLKDDYPNNMIINLKNSDKIDFGFLTVEEEIELKEYKKSLGEVDSETLKTLSLAGSISTINDKELTLQERFNYLNGLNPTDYIYLLTIIKKYDFGIKDSFIVKCDKCGGNVPVGVTFQPDFFIPEYNIGSNTGS